MHISEISHQGLLSSPVPISLCFVILNRDRSFLLVEMNELPRFPPANLFEPVAKRKSLPALKDDGLEEALVLILRNSV